MTAESTPEDIHGDEDVGALGRGRLNELRLLGNPLKCDCHARDQDACARLVLTLLNNYPIQISQCTDYHSSNLHPLYSLAPPRLQSTSSPFGHWKDFPEEHLRKGSIWLRLNQDTYNFHKPWHDAVWTDAVLVPVPQPPPLDCCPRPPLHYFGVVELCAIFAENFTRGGAVKHAATFTPESLVYMHLVVAVTFALSTFSVRINQISHF